jgi:hypothetical protein
MKNNKNFYYQELISKQRKNLASDKKLTLLDLKRISSYLNASIFTCNCSLWSGYVTQFKNNCPYVNFFYNGKKQALHRLLYYNFIDDVGDNEYLKFNCENKGKCCCINHIIKVRSNNTKPKEIIYDCHDEIKETKKQKNITVEF